MPKRRTHLPGKYKTKTDPEPNFTGPKPLTPFQAENGLWGVKDGAGNIEIEPEYVRAEETERDRLNNTVRLVSRFDVIDVSPDDWKLVAFYCPD